MAKEGAYLKRLLMEERKDTSGVERKKKVHVGDTHERLLKRSSIQTGE